MVRSMFDSNKRGKNDVLFKEQRTKQRYEAEIAVDFSITGDTIHTFYLGFAQDISEGGVFLATHQSYPIGSVMTINLDIAGSKISVEAVVRWVRDPKDFEGSDIEPGMGLQFVNLPEKEKSIIDAFIQKREPMFVDVD